MTGGPGRALEWPTPLSRLYACALEGGILMVRYEDMDYDEGPLPWPDEGVLAYVSPRMVILRPDPDALVDEVHAALIAMAISTAADLVDGLVPDPGHGLMLTGDYVLIMRDRVPVPATGPGALAGLLARICGLDGFKAFRCEIPAMSTS